jgi:phospholipid/cholesterol/gamma-HCH transport system ATP-binding protein
MFKRSQESAEPIEESPFGPHATALLDQAAEFEYQLHEGAVEFAEEQPGYFWSIRVIDVYKAFGSTKILRGVDLGIPEGMITVILGPSGTGKSVMIKHLIGLMYPDQGDVIVHGESMREMTQTRLLETRKKFGILFQDGALFGSMSVFNNIAFPLRQHTDLSEAEIAQIVNERLSDVGLTEAANRLPNELSGGMRKRAGFARALVLEPDVVMFDEPDSGLDPVRTALLCTLIHKMHERYGGTYIVITHNTAAVRSLGEYIAVLWKGRIVQAGSRDQMFTSANPFVRQFLAGAEEGPLGME